MENNGNIRVHEPASRRLLFVYNPKNNTVAIKQRGIHTEVNLAKIAADPDDATAIVSTIIPATQAKTA